MKKSRLFLIVSAFSVMIFSGCSTVPLEPKEVSESAKLFKQPSEGNAGIYVYRNSFVGQALKKDIWIDNECLGETANNIFFYKSVKGNKKHTLSTESEFSPNNLTINTESGKNYFVRQYIKMGVFVGGAGLELIDEEEGKTTVSKLEMAQQGNCSK